MGAASDHILKRTMANVAIEREIAALSTDEALSARCVAEAADFVIVVENTDAAGPCNVARWTDRIGGKRGLRLPVDEPRDMLLKACLHAMLVRDLP
jgi:hypothetical protein